MDSTITLNGESFTIGDATDVTVTMAGAMNAIRAATGSEGFDSYLQGNIMKYLWRYQYKNGVEDLKKAQWYLSRLIEAQDVS